VLFNGALCRGCARMFLKEVIETCLDFTSSNDGVIGSYGPGGRPTADQLQIRFRNGSRVEIAVARDPGDPQLWRVERTQDRAGERVADVDRERLTVGTPAELVSALTRFWTDAAAW
jgi:hypothetical protein